MPSYKKFSLLLSHRNERGNEQNAIPRSCSTSKYIGGRQNEPSASFRREEERGDSFQSASLSMKCQHWHGRVLQQHSAWTKGRTCANWAKTWANNPLCMQNSLSFREIQESFPARAFHIFYLHNFEKSEGILLWFWVQMLRPVNISPLAVPFRLLVLSHYSLFPLLPPT